MARKSKKGSRDWRKRSSVKDIEAVLDKARDEALLGGPVSVRKDEELFFMDKKGTMSSAAKKSKKGLKIDEILEPNKYAQGPGTYKEKEGESEKEKKQVARMVRAMQKRSGEVKKKRSEGDVYDVWEKDLNPVQELSAGFTNPMQKLKVKTPKHITEAAQGPKTTAVVPVPRASSARPKLPLHMHPGYSYHPHPNEHRQLLEIAAKDEVTKSAILEKWDSVAIEARSNVIERHRVRGLLRSAISESEVEFYDTRKGVRTEKKAQKQDETSDEEEAEDEEPSDEEPSEEEDKPQPRTKKPSLQVKDLLKKMDKAKAAKAKNAKANLDRKFDRLHRLVRGIDRQRELRREKRRQMAEKKKEKELLPKRLGRKKFESPNIDVALSHQLPSNLRGIKPQGNLIKDQFFSFQQRNMIEPRDPTTLRRKYPLKVIDLKWREFNQQNEQKS